MTYKNLQELELKIGHIFDDKNLLLTSMMHPSYKNEIRGCTNEVRYCKSSFGKQNNKRSNKQNKRDEATTSTLDYQRLEFLGDAVIGLVIADILYAQFPNVNEGGLSIMQSNLVNTNVMFEIATSLNLGKYLLLGAGEEIQNGRNNVKNLENALEAIIGAAFLDGGYNVAVVIVKLLWEKKLFLPHRILASYDHKSTLQHIVQKMKMQLPTYHVVERRDNKTNKNHNDNVDNYNNRPLSKFASDREVIGAYGAEDRSVHVVHEDLSTGATPQFSAEVEFRKRFNEAALFVVECTIDHITIGKKSTIGYGATKKQAEADAAEKMLKLL